jgi:hypothetical protein
MLIKLTIFLIVRLLLDDLTKKKTLTHANFMKYDTDHIIEQILIIDNPRCKVL